MSWAGLLIGAIALIVLEAAVGSPAAASRAGGFFTGAGGVAQRFLSPAVPLLGAPPAQRDTPPPTSGGGGGHDLPVAAVPPSNQPILV
jgi:hypothetical protein